MLFVQKHRKDLVDLTGEKRPLQECNKIRRKILCLQKQADIFPSEKQGGLA